MRGDHETEKVEGPIPGEIVERNFVDSTTFQLLVEKDGELYEEYYTYEETVRIVPEEEQ